MFQEPKIVMDLEQLPQQRLQAVVELPERPTGFKSYCEYIDPMPEKDCPKGSPRKVEFLGSVEWAWSPMNSRWDAYFLNPRGNYRLLWTRYLDDNEWPPKWRWNLYAWGLKKGVSEKESAVYLLADAWAAEAQESDLDHFHLINDPGLLTIPELCAIGRWVWPGGEFDE